MYHCKNTTQGFTFIVSLLSDLVISPVCTSSTSLQSEQATGKKATNCPYGWSLFQQAKNKGNSGSVCRKSTGMPTMNNLHYVVKVRNSPWPILNLSGRLSGEWSNIGWGLFPDEVSYIPNSMLAVCRFIICVSICCWYYHNTSTTCFAENKVPQGTIIIFRSRNQNPMFL